MQRCLQLAALGLGQTRSNPMVGCVVVEDDKIIAEGFHKGYGLPHAEVDALSKLNAEKNLSRCTVYVNLEPCSHHGKTPPCADFLISRGVKSVVIASLDPNPLVSGNGVRKLREAGVEVVVGLLESESLELNKRFFTFHTKKRPFIFLKWAQSNDGFISPLNHKDSYALTNSVSNTLVHKWRSEEMGILVGRKTVENDNPQLTVRHVPGENPVRIVFDTDCKLTEDRLIFDDKATTIVFNLIKDNENSTVKWIKLKGENFLLEAMQKLYALNIISVLVEGGTVTLQHFINNNRWDEARIFKTQQNLKIGIPAPLIEGTEHSVSELDTDKLIQLIPN